MTTHAIQYKSLLLRVWHRTKYFLILFSWGARAKRAFFSLVFQGKKSLFITGRTSIGCQNQKQNILLYQVGMRVWFNIVIGYLGRPYSTHTAAMPVLTGSVHAHILTKPSRAGFAAIRLELIEPGATTCVYQAKACSPTYQPVGKFKDGLDIITSNWW